MINYREVDLLGSTYTTTQESEAVEMQHSLGAAVQCSYTNATGSAKTAVTGTSEVHTLNFADKGSTTNGDYISITDTNGDKWAASLSVNGIREVSSITAIAEGSVAEKTQIVAIAEGSAKNTTQVIAVADVSASLAGTYFKVGDTDGTSTCAIWFSIGGVPAAAPAGALLCTRAVEVAITADDSAGTVAGKITTAFAADVKLVVGNVGATVTITDVAYGARIAASDGAAGDATGFAITTTLAGHASNLHRKYFILKDEVGTVAFWIDVDNAGGSAPSHGADRAVEITTITSEMTASQVATAVYNAIDGDAKFNGVSDTTGTIVVVSTTYGDKTGQSAGDSGFTVTQHTAGVASAITGKYFLLGDVDGTVGVWFDVGNEGTAAPAGATGANRALEITTVTRGMTAAQVAGALRTAIDADGKFDVGTLTDATFTVTCLDYKSVANIAAGDSGFTVSTITQGADLCVAPTGAIWAAIPAGKKCQVDISGVSNDEDIAPLVKTAMDLLSGFTDVITLDHSAGDGTMTITHTVRAPVTVAVPKNADDSGAGSIAVSDTTNGVASTVNVTGNTITIASHGWSTGLKAALTISAGSLPTGLSATDYYIIVVDSNTIKLAESLANAIAGTEVDITDQGTGAKTMTLTPASIGGAVLHLECSNDKSTWIDIASQTVNISTTGTTMFHLSNAYYRYLRAHFTCTAGQVTVRVKVSLKDEE